MSRCAALEDSNNLLESALASHRAGTDCTRYRTPRFYIAVDQLYSYSPVDTLALPRARVGMRIPPQPQPVPARKLHSTFPRTVLPIPRLDVFSFCSETESLRSLLGGREAEAVSIREHARKEREELMARLLRDKGRCNIACAKCFPPVSFLEYPRSTRCNQIMTAMRV